MSDVIQNLREKFGAQADEGLARIETWIGEIDQVAEPRPLVSRIREEAHGLKGAAAVLEYPEFSARMAELEDFCTSLGDEANRPADTVGRLHTLLAQAMSQSPRATRAAQDDLEPGE